MPRVAWDAGRSVRGELQEEFPVRIPLKCRCGRSLGFLYGNTKRPFRRYYQGRVPQVVLSNAPMSIECHRRCRGDYPVSLEVLTAAWLAALAKPAESQVILFPYDLKPVPRRVQPMRRYGSFIGR
jgi:hypothetical protein